MKRKRILLSILLVSFCALVVPAGLVFNGISYTHAAGAMPKVTGQHTPATLAKPTPSAIVQGNVYHGSTVCDTFSFINGLCVAIVQGNVLYGQTGHSVYALNAKTGVLLWQYQVGSSNYCLGYIAVGLLGIVNGVVYVNTCRADCPSHLAALKASDGSQLWCSPVNFAAYSGIVSLAKVAKGIVYIIPYTPCGDTCDIGILYALKESDGSQLWKYGPTGGIELYGIDQGVAYLTTYYETTLSSSLVACALNTRDGSKRWCHSNAQIIGLERGVVYVTAYSYSANYYSGYSILALKESNGTQLWRYSGGSQGQEFSQALVQLDVIYISAYLPSNASSTLCAVNVRNGSQRWCARNPVAGSLKVIGGIIYNIEDSYNNTGAIQAFSTSTGALLWTKQAASLIGLGQSVAYVLTSTYHVEGINATNGSLLWNYNTSQSGTAYFAPTDGVIYYNTSHGLRALSASTGTLLWSHFAATNVYLSFQSDSRAIAYVVSTNTTPNSLTLNAYNSSNGTLLWKYTTR
jgi:outer membrane protein assembly factor BamB